MPVRRPLGAISSICMKVFGLLILLLSIVSCSSTESEENNTPVSTQETKAIQKSENPQITALREELANAFYTVSTEFPSDSASLYEFYFIYFPASTEDKLRKQIERLSRLMDTATIQQYHEVESELKPLLTQITSSGSASVDQANKLVELYSFYDRYSGEALFSGLFSNEENYALVWGSLRIMANQSPADTTFISALITLDREVRTNVELAQGLGEIKVVSIKNNPTGFLDMYAVRSDSAKMQFSSNAMIWGDPDEKLNQILDSISTNSPESRYRDLARELLQDINAGA